MKLTIVSVDISDFGMYKCVAKNSLGETDGSIKLYRKYTNFALNDCFSVFFCQHLNLRLDFGLGDHVTPAKKFGCSM